MTQGKTHREPLLRIAKRDGIARPKAWAIRIIAVLLSLVVSGIFIFAVTKLNPFQVYEGIFDGAFGTPRRSWVTVRDAMMLLCIGVGLAPAFKMRFWNIGAEGQITAGAMCATYFALFWADSIPQVPLLLIMCAAGAIGGGLWALVPAFFKARWGTNETLFTLMMNYIIIGVVKWLQGGPWEKIPRGSQQIEQFASNACLPRVAGVYCGWIVVLALTVFMFLYMKYTKHGYEIAVVGDSPNTARYAGMKVGRIVVRTIFLSAALIGLAGAFYVSSAGTLSTSVTNDVGWTGIVVAWLAKLNTVGIVITALLITVLQFGCQAASTTYSSIDANFADLIQGIILFAVLAADFFTRFRLARRAAAPKEVSK